MKVILINPPIELYPKEFVAIIAPLGLAYIAAVLEKEGHEIKILDCLALSWRSPLLIKRAGKTVKRLAPTDQFLKQEMKNFAPDVFGISNLVSPTEKETLRLAKKIKHWFPKITVVIGGSNASARPSYFARDPNVNFVVVGEGEITMTELLKLLSVKNPDQITQIAGLVYRGKRNKIITTPPRPFISDLDNIPFPAWPLLPLEEYFHGQHNGIFVLKQRLATV